MNLLPEQHVGLSAAQSRRQAKQEQEVGVGVRLAQFTARGHSEGFGGDAFLRLELHVAHAGRKFQVLEPEDLAVGVLGIAGSEPGHGEAEVGRGDDVALEQALGAAERGVERTLVPGLAQRVVAGAGQGFRFPVGSGFGREFIQANGVHLGEPLVAAAGAVIVTRAVLVAQAGDLGADHAEVLRVSRAGPRLEVGGALNLRGKVADGDVAPGFTLGLELGERGLPAVGLQEGEDALGFRGGGDAVGGVEPEFLPLAQVLETHASSTPPDLAT